MAEQERALARWSPLCLLLIVFFLPIVSSRVLTFQDPSIGVNFGRLGSNLPSIKETVKLISSLSIRNVKTFDMDTSVIRAFAKTNISLSLCIPNKYIASLASDPSKADRMVRHAILPFVNKTMISTISVGNEVSMLPEFAQTLVPAMRNVYRSLRKIGLHGRIRVSTPHSLAVLAVRFPPSYAVFQESIAESVMRPVFRLLNLTKSPFMVNLYPYLTYKETPFIPLDYALFTQDPQVFNYTDPKTGLVYLNLFDLLVDSLSAAASGMGFQDLPIVVTETGWPSEGSPDDAAASLANAATFNQMLVKHVVKGTPRRPGVPVMTFIFSMFDEDLKVGAPTEKHWGLFYANGTSKYQLRLPRDLGTSM